MKIDSKIIELSNEIAVRSGEEAEYFPVDRYFLDNYLEEILSVDHLQFIFCNLESVNKTYAVLLMACLPELWTEIEYDDFAELISNFTNPFSFFTLIQFTYMYIEIDVIDMVLQCDNVSDENKRSVVAYVKNQYNNFFKSEIDYEEAKEGLIGIDFDQWAYIKQKMLLDPRLKPAKSFAELKKYVERL